MSPKTKIVRESNSIVKPLAWSSVRQLAIRNPRNTAFVGLAIFLTCFVLAFAYANIMRVLFPSAPVLAAPLKTTSEPALSVSYNATTIQFTNPDLDVVSKDYITQTVTTDSPAGFTTYVEVNDATMGNCLKYSSNASTSCNSVPANQKFEAISTAGSGDAAIGANTWAIGRFISPSTYNWIVPNTSDTTFYSQSTAAANVDTHIAVGIHPTLSQYAGNYNGTMTISTIANAPASPTITYI